MKRPPFILITLLVLLTISCQNQNKKTRQTTITFKETFYPYHGYSPLVRHLLDTPEAQRQQLADSLWTVAQDQGLPVIEQDKLDPNYVWITLLHRDSREHIQVHFDMFGTYGEYRFGEQVLRHLTHSDLWYQSYRVPHDICFSYRYRISREGHKHDDYLVDPYNPNTIPTGQVHSYSYSVLDLAPDSHLTDLNRQQTDIPTSRLDTLQYRDKIVQRDHPIFVYLPPGYDPKRAEAYPVIYLFDAFIYLNRVEVPHILDHLLADNKIAPTVAVFFGTYRDTRKVLLPLNKQFMREFVEDFVPIIHKRYHVSHNPQKTTIGGMSYGGLASAYIALNHPDMFGRVLSQSGSFWRDLTYTDAYNEAVASDWLIEQILKTERQDIRFYLDWGLQENLVLSANRRMVRALTSKGYNCTYHEFNGWHDWSCSRKTFVNGVL